MKWKSGKRGPATVGTAFIGGSSSGPGAMQLDADDSASSHSAPVCWGKPGVVGVDGGDCLKYMEVLGSTSSSCPEAGGMEGCCCGG